MVARKVAWRVADTQECILRESRTRLQDTVDTEVVQSSKASATDSPGQTAPRFSSGPAQSSSSDTALTAGRPAPEDSNVVNDHSCGKFDDTADDETNDSGDGD